MTLSLTTRSGKGSPLTHGEVDQNWTDIQTDVNNIINSGTPDFKNRIINGNFDIWQRGTSFTAGPAYSADRVRFSFGDGAGTISRQSFSLGQTDVPNEPTYFWRHDRTTAATSANSPFQYRIEDVRTFAGRTATLSFYAKVAAGTKTITPRIIQSFGTGGTPSSSVTTNGSDITLTTAWQRFTTTFNIPSISGKTLGTNNDHFLQVDLNEGSSFSTFTLDMSQVQFEIGSVATTFHKRHIQQELSLCQRYYEKTYSLETAPGTASTSSGRLGGRAVGTGTTGFLSTWYYKVTKRTGPTITVYSPVTGTSGQIRDEDGAADIAGQAISGNQNSVIIASAAATTNGNFYAAHVTADAEL